MTLCRRTSRKVVINDPPPRGEDGRGVWPCITRRFCLVRLVDGRFFAFMAANCRDLDVKLASRPLRNGHEGDRGVLELVQSGDMTATILVMRLGPTPSSPSGELLGGLGSLQ